MHNLRVKTEERDIYVNKRYYRELSDRLGEDGRSRLPVPQVFISGQHIGVGSSVRILVCPLSFRKPFREKRR